MTLTIAEVAQRSGLPATTLRYYESIALIPRPSRVGQRRRYDEDVLDLLIVIRAARGAGFVLAEVKTLLDAIGREGPGSAWSALASGKRVELWERLRRLKQMIALLDSVSRCECTTLNECASQLS